MGWSDRSVLMVVAGVLALTSCTSTSDPVDAVTATPRPTIGASHRGDIDVLAAVLVMNRDGSATVSARIVNNTDQPRTIGDVTLRDPGDGEYPLRSFGLQAHSMIDPGETVTTGNIGDPVRIRMFRDVTVGQEVPLDFRFDAEDTSFAELTVSLDVPVVPRSETYADVVGEKPNTAITIENARIVVVPGQKKAYVNGTLVSTIDDQAYDVPTAKNSAGKSVAYLHQSATGGPYGIFATKSEASEIGMGPPYTDHGVGDADYLNADDLTIGETITVTIRFGSGDVIVPFTVVAA